MVNNSTNISKTDKYSPTLYSLNTKYNLHKDGLSYINLCLTLLFVIEQ
jgi:hypothetical protein